MTNKLTGDGRVVEVPVVRVPAPSIAQGPIGKYLRAALARLDYVEHGDPRDFILRTGKPDASHTSLSKVWVPAIVRNEASSNADDTVESMLADGHTARLVLSEPGGGKSTLARYIVCKTIKTALDGAGNKIGIFVPVSKYRYNKAYRSAIAECAANFVELGEDAEVVRAIEESLDHAVVVFDGLDEAPTRRDLATDSQVALKKEVASHINTLRVDPERPEPHKPVSVQFVVTSRADDYDRDRCLVQTVVYRLTEFSPPQMSDAIDRWHAAARDIAIQNGDTELAGSMQSRAVAIKDALREDPELCKICQTPLMLATLQIVYQPTDDLPSSVSQLCDKAVEWLLVTKPANSGNAFVREHAQWIASAIARLGLRVQERVVASNNLSPLDEDELRAVCLETCPIEEDEEREISSAKVFVHLRRGHGILTVANKEVSFVHNVFREVLAGRCLGSSRLSELGQLALNEAWHPAIRYWAGLKAPTEAGRNEISALFGELDVYVSQGSHAAILAQAEILAEARTEAPEDQLSQDLRTRLQKTRDKLEGLLKSPQLVLSRRVKVGDLLGAVGDSRIAMDDVKRVAKVEGGVVEIGRTKNHNASEKKYLKVPASPLTKGTLRPYRIGLYEVTNGEYAAFIKAGGYRNAGYWPNPLAWKWATRDAATLEALAEKAFEQKIHFGSEQKAGRLDREDPEIKRWCERIIRRELPLHWGNPAFNRSNQPVVGISWWEACAYCRWRTEVARKNSWIAKDDVVRLPTEAEWETAARTSGGNEQYPWIAGDPEDNALVSDICKSHQLARSIAVGSFEFIPMRVPIFDLVGNVWEWTASLVEGYGPGSFAQTVDELNDGDRIARGSSWMSQEIEASEITFRSFDPPYFAYEDLGFRIVVAQAGGV